MFKMLVAGLIGVAATMGGWFAGRALSSNAGKTKTGPSDIQQITTELNGAPVIVDGHVDGYIVFKISSSVDKNKLPDAKLDVSPFLLGAAFEAAYQQYDKGIPLIRPTDLPDMSKRVQDSANKTIGAEAVQNVEFEQFNYISSDKIRENMFSHK